MSTAADDEATEEGIVFHREDDGSITATDLETGLSRGAETRAEALAQLAEVLELEERGGEPIDDPDSFLKDELGIDPNELEKRDSLPEFLR